MKTGGGAPRYRASEVVPERMAPMMMKLGRICAMGGQTASVWRCTSSIGRGPPGTLLRPRGDAYNRLWPGGYRSGQTGLTVDQLAECLRRFESFPAHQLCSPMRG